MSSNPSVNQQTNLEKVFVPHAYSHVVAIVNPKSGERQASDFVYSSLCEALSDPHKVHRLDAESFRDTTRMREMIKSYCVLFSEGQEVVSIEEIAEVKKTLIATKPQTSVVEILSTRKDIGSDDDLAENLGNRRPSSNLSSPKASPKDFNNEKNQTNNPSTPLLPPNRRKSIISPSEYASADRGTVVVAGGDGTVCFIMSVVDTVRDELEALVATERKVKVREAVQSLIANGSSVSMPLTITVRSPVIPAIGVIAMGTGNDLSNSLGYGLGYTKYPAPPCCCLCCDACVHVVKDILDSLVLKAVAVPFDRWQVSVTPIRELVTDVVSEAVFDEEDDKKVTSDRSLIFSTSTVVPGQSGTQSLQVPSNARRRTLSIAFDAELIGQGALMRSASALHLQASAGHSNTNSSTNTPSTNLRTLLEGQTPQVKTTANGKKRTTVVVDTQRFRAHNNGAERAGIFSDPANDEHTLVMASSFYRFAKSTSDTHPPANASAATQHKSSPPAYSPADASTSTADISNSNTTVNNNSASHASQPLSPQTRLVVEERLTVPSPSCSKQQDGTKGGRRRKSILEVSTASPVSPPSPATVLPPGSPNSDPAVGPKPTRRFIAMNYFSLGMDAFIATTFDTLRKQHPSLFNSRLMNKMWYGSLGLYGWAKSDRLDDNIYFMDVATEEGVVDGSIGAAVAANNKVLPPLPREDSPKETSIATPAAKAKPDEILLPRSSLDSPSTTLEEDRLEMQTPPTNKRSTMEECSKNMFPPIVTVPPLPTPIHFPPKTKCLVLSNVGSYSGGAKLWKTTDKAATKAADSRRALVDRIRKNNTSHSTRLSNNSSPIPHDDSQLDRPLVSNKHAHANSSATTPTGNKQPSVVFDPYNGLSDENLALLNGAKGYEHVSTSDDRIEVQAVGGLLDMMLLQSKMTPTKPMAQSQVVRIVVGHPEHHPSKVARRVADTVEELRRKQKVVDAMTEKAKTLAIKQYNAQAAKDHKALSQAGKNRPELHTRYLDPQQKVSLVAEHEAAIMAKDKDLAAAKSRIEELRSLLEVAPDWTIGVSRQQDTTSDNSDVIGGTPIDALRRQRPETLQEALATAIHSEVLNTPASDKFSTTSKPKSALTLNQTLNKSVCFQVDGEPSGYITEPSLIEVRPYPKQILVRSLTAPKM